MDHCLVRKYHTGNGFTRHGFTRHVGCMCVMSERSTGLRTPCIRESGSQSCGHDAQDLRKRKKTTTLMYSDVVVTLMREI